MKLIELIIKNVPRADIHPDAKFFAQDNHMGNIGLSQFEEPPTSDYSGHRGFWFDDSYITGSQMIMSELAEDANDTVVTRAQLEYLWYLQDKGFTLVFDGKCPVPVDTNVMVVPVNATPGEIDSAGCFNWELIAAYKLPTVSTVKNGSRSVIDELSVDVTVDMKKRLELFDKSCDGVWPGEDWETFAVTAAGQIIRTNPEKIITRKMWDDYVSRKIRVGDKVTVSMGSTIHEVLFIGEDTAFLRADSGFEIAAALNILTRVSE